MPGQDAFELRNIALAKTVRLAREQHVPDRVDQGGFSFSSTLTTTWVGSSSRKRAKLTLFVPPSLGIARTTARVDAKAGPPHDVPRKAKIAQELGQARHERYDAGLARDRRVRNSGGIGQRPLICESHDLPLHSGFRKAPS